MANEKLPNEQAGWTPQRNGAEHILSTRLTIEMCERMSISHARCYVDLGGFFESVPHEAQWLIEAAIGVNPHV